MKNTILFICSGNYYRSRYAEIIFNTWAKDKELNWEAFSRGLKPSSQNSGAISIHTLEALEKLNIIHENPRMPLKLTQNDLEIATRIIALKEAEHRPMLEKQFPDFIHLVEFWEVHDTDKAQPSEALPEIEVKVKKILKYLIKD